jgi:hypothetical protein
MRVSLWIITVVLSFSVCVGVCADENTDALAEAAFYSGVQHFQEKRYDEAADAFRQAAELKGNWKIQYNLGQSEAAAKHHGLALEAFEKYMAEGGDDVPAERQQEIIAEIQRLRVLCGALDIVAPAGAVVTVNGLERGRTPLPGALLLAAGMEHRILITKGDKVLLERPVKVRGGRSIEIRAQENALPNSQKTNGNKDTEEETYGARDKEVEAGKLTTASTVEGKDKSSLKLPGWVLLGVGGATLIVGVVTGAMAVSHANTLDDNCTGKECANPSDMELADSMDALAITTDVLLPVGGLAAVTGMVLLIVGRDFSKSSRQKDVSVAPWMAPGRGGVVLEGRF